MNREVPEDLSLKIRNAALPLRDALVDAGWMFGSIHWDGAGFDRKLAFSAMAPTGRSVYVACHENDLAGKLQAILDSIKPASA